VMFNTPEIRYELADEIKFEVVKRAVALFRADPAGLDVVDIDGARVTWPNEGGWALVRASNTQAALVMRFEAPTAKKLEELHKLVEDKIKHIEADVRSQAK